MTQYTYLLVLMLVTLTGVGVANYMLFIQRKKAYFLLVEENKKILLQIEGLQAANAKLQINSERLEEFNKTKDKFFSIISHDLKGPLNSLTGLLQILMKYADSFSKVELKDFGQNMDKSVHNLLDLLQNLFQWSQTQNGMMAYRPQSVELYEIVQKTVGISHATAANKEINISVDVDEAIFVYADVDMLSFTLRNLLSNAIKFTNNGGNILVHSSIKNDKVEISVSDNGIGMNPSILEKLFKIDTCHTTNGTNNEMGTGLGLILCNEFITRNGGTIKVESEVNKGSTFRFSLPIVYAEMAVNI